MSGGRWRADYPKACAGCGLHVYENSGWFEAKGTYTSGRGTHTAFSWHWECRTAERVAVAAGKKAA